MSDSSFNEASAARHVSTASPEIQDLARRLIAFEAAHENSSSARGDVTLLVIEELRLRLIRFAGVDGFRSLLSRALALAKMEVPSLQAVKVRADGTLSEFDGVEQSQEAGSAGPAGIVLVAHLLQLLVTFVGEPLTLRLVSDTWPDVSMSATDLKTEEKS